MPKRRQVRQIETEILAFRNAEPADKYPGYSPSLSSSRSDPGMARNRTCDRLVRTQKTNKLPKFRRLTGGHLWRVAGEAENVRFSVEKGNPPPAWQCACYGFWEKSKNILGVRSDQDAARLIRH